MPSIPAVELVVGFEATMGALRALMEDAQDVAVLVPAPLANEFAFPFLDLVRSVTRHGTLRVLVLEDPEAETGRILREQGAEVRVSGERRELGMLLSERGVCLFPVGPPQRGPLVEWGLFLEDARVLLTLRVGFDAAWREAREPSPAASAPGVESQVAW